MLRPFTIVVLLSFLLFGQRTNRDRDKGPYLWDDDLILEMQAVREDHKHMSAQISINTEKLAHIERVEKSTEDLKVSERLTAVETKLLGLEWIGATLAAAVILNLINSLFIKKRTY